ncbi:MAG TPA: AsmA family protein [Acidobacteriaceae bacterium]|nr:AsmA family protein [Acidobacteriaceae bacterium]
MPSLEDLVSSEESQSPRAFPWRRVAMVAGLIVLLLMAIFLPPLINLGKYRRSITASMSEALGRPVYVGGMQLRLLPTPGIVMSDLTVDEDPAFGEEPALHATSVVASLRLTSLWRGRLEVSRISLDEANLNLVKNSAGQWSIGSVLLRASQIANAPTAQRHASARPRFPYIEATDARIDFKDGVEKKPFSLMNAEFSMWQAGSDEWRLRLRAQPVRTDLELHLSDTGASELAGGGEVTLEGSLRRAAVLDAMPVDLRAEWSGAQLGQVSRLLAGMDPGWRASLDATSTIRGSFGDLQIQSRLHLADLRRQEFQPPVAVDVDATCRSDYRRVQRTFGNITCFWPVASGHFLLTGSIQGFESPKADLQLEINEIPATFPLNLLELIRPGAQNVSATGTVNGSFHFASGGSPLVSGTAEAAGVSLRYPGGVLTLPTMHFVAPPQEAPPSRHTRHAPSPSPGPNAIQLLPLSVAVGETQPMVAEARLLRGGFEIHFTGQAALARLFPAAANFGMLENAARIVAPHGRATLNLTTTGAWMRPLAGPGTGIGTTGTVTVESAELRPAFLPDPVEVQSAEVDLTPQQIAWRNVSLSYQKTPMQGSLRFPTQCADPAGCPAEFALAMGPTSGAAIETAAGADPDTGFFGRLLRFGQSRPAWPPLSGEIQCDQVDLGSLVMKNVAATLGIAGNTLHFASLDASALGGTLHWSGEMRMQDDTAQWKLKVRLANASAGAISKVFSEQWGPGEIDGEASLSMTGLRASDLASSTTGDFSFTWQRGAFARTAAANNSGLTPFERWTAKGTIAGNALKLTGGDIVHAGRAIPVHGSIGFDRSLDLTLETRRGEEKISGTLEKPVAGATVRAVQP